MSGELEKSVKKLEAEIAALREDADYHGLHTPEDGELHSRGVSEAEDSRGDRGLDQGTREDGQRVPGNATWHGCRYRG